MIVNDIHKLIAAWAPPDIAWERDNVGLQVGDRQSEIDGILVCLDCTAEVVIEARKRKANLIISHHPLLFRPPKSITPHDEIGRTIQELIRNNVNLYSAHTNLDFARGGTSFAIAGALGLRDVEFLHSTYRIQRKIVTFVPGKDVENVRERMSEAGAGNIGNYDHCSFGTAGQGSFRGNAMANPAVGGKGTLEHVTEVRLEMIANQWDVPGVLKAMKASHPYEEVAYDVYPLENLSNEFGMGIIGTLAKPMNLLPFLNLVKKQLHATALRHSAGMNKPIRRVAACGGAGSDLVDSAIALEADVFITADVRYHDFHHAAGRIVMIDAGHYETEHLVIREVVHRLKNEMKKAGETIPVFPTRLSTNPLHYS